MPRVSIRAPRFLAGYKDESTGVFHVNLNRESVYVFASPQYPVTLELPEGLKVDREMRRLPDDGQAQPEPLKKHFADTAPSHPHAREDAPPLEPLKAEPPAASKPTGKPGRASDKSPI